MNRQIITSLGLISGTSMDGVDAALVRSDGEYQLERIAGYFFAYPTEAQILFKALEYSAKQHQGNLIEIEKHFLIDCEAYLRMVNASQTVFTLQAWIKTIFSEDHLDFMTVCHLSYYYNYLAAEHLCFENKILFSDINLIGYHGQTIYHNPAKKISLQIADAALMADSTGVNVVSNFRANDLKNGGQAAPLAPIYHHALAKQKDLSNAVIINCGGIANITYLGKEVADLIAYDSGPGNVLLDRLIRIKTNNLKQFDLNGELGLMGKCNDSALVDLFDHAVILNGENFFDIKPPKSLDTSNFTLPNSILELPLEDACCTLAAFTAEAVWRELAHLPSLPEQIILAGGGWNNLCIRKELQLRNKNKIPLATASEAGWSTDFLEAELIAYLAIRATYRLPITFPKTTGVNEPLTGGDYFKAEAI